MFHFRSEYADLVEGGEEKIANISICSLRTIFDLYQFHASHQVPYHRGR